MWPWGSRLIPSFSFVCYFFFFSSTHQFILTQQLTETSGGHKAQIGDEGLIPNVFSGDPPSLLFNVFLIHIYYICTFVTVAIKNNWYMNGLVFWIFKWISFIVALYSALGYSRWKHFFFGAYCLTLALRWINIYQLVCLFIWRIRASGNITLKIYWDGDGNGQMDR